MPDIHWGYGFAIGGVAATDPEQGGVISPGGVGYDINCGVRLLRSDLEWADVKPKDPPARRPALPRHPDRRRPVRLLPVREAGIGPAHGGGLVLRRRSRLGEPARPGFHRGRRPSSSGPIPDLVSDRAYTRGYDQCGTLGSGNHFLEVQVVDRVHDQEAASKVMGLREGQVTVLIHSGSRGPRLSGLRRLSGRLQAGHPSEVRLPPARPPARLRSGPEPRRRERTSAP